MASATKNDGQEGALLRNDVAGQFRATRLEQALEWAASLAPSPLRLATSCCGMSMVQGGDFFELLGTGPPAVSSRSADLLVVAGSLSRKQVDTIRGVYQRMLEPRWVIAWGACAISGGPYDNYATVSGLSRIIPVDLVVPGCPPSPVALRGALAALRDIRSGHSSESERGLKHTASSGMPDWPIQRAEPVS
ncbi:MAG: NADH-quinone oxidoreductase subunit B [Myxococcota bacterium]